MKYRGIKILICARCKEKRQCFFYIGSGKRKRTKGYCMSCAKTPRGNQ